MKNTNSRNVVVMGLYLTVQGQAVADERTRRKGLSCALTEALMMMMEKIRRYLFNSLI